MTIVMAPDSVRDHGGVAQLGERLPCKQDVRGSIPLISSRERREERRKIVKVRPGEGYSPERG